MLILRSSGAPCSSDDSGYREQCGLSIWRQAMNNQTNIKHSNPIPTQEETDLLTSLGFWNKTSNPILPCFELAEFLETPFCNIRVIAHIDGCPMWRKYHLLMFLTVRQHQCGGDELAVRRLKGKASTIAEALRFFGFKHEEASTLQLRAQPTLEHEPQAPLSPHLLKTYQKLPCSTQINMGGTGPSWLKSGLRVRASRPSFRFGGKSWRKNGKSRQSCRLSGNLRGAYER